MDGLETLRDVRGLLSSARSQGGPTVLDEIRRLSNDFGQMTREHKEHDGEVDGSTLHVDDAYAEGSLALTRTHNQANEITAIAEPEDVVQPAYDPAGNKTQMPKVGAWTVSCALKWDAWNRLTSIEQGTADPIHYHYDALSRRILTDAVTDVEYYYDDQWRPVQKVGQADPVYVWGVLNRWDLVLRRYFGDRSRNV